MKRANLTVETGAHVRKLVVDGLTARGVEIEQAGTIRTIHCRREVILAAGAVGTPSLTFTGDTDNTPLAKRRNVSLGFMGSELAI